MLRAVLMAASNVSRLCSANRSRWVRPSASRTSYSSKARLRELSSVSDMAAYLLREWPESKCANRGWIARLICVMEGQNKGRRWGAVSVGAGLPAMRPCQPTFLSLTRRYRRQASSHIFTAFSQLTDGHQAGVTARRSGVNTQRPLDHQTLQRNRRLTLRQTIDRK